MAVRTSDNMRNQLAHRAEQAQTPTPTNGSSPVATVAQLFKQMKPQLEQALPKHVTADRLLRVALFTIRNNPKLLECDPMSLVAAVTQAAQLGLEPGILGHCYLVPFRNNAAGRTDVQFILGYKGMIELARRSGNVQTIDAHEVYERDRFDYEFGLNPRLEHKPALKDRGRIIAYYAVVRFKDGGHIFSVMSVEDIEKRRKRSRAANNGPWQTDYDAMAIKTVIRSIFRYMPVSVELQQSLALDGTAPQAIKPPEDGVPGIEIVADYPPSAIEQADGTQVDTTTGEVLSEPGDEGDPFAEDEDAIAEAERAGKLIE